MDMKEGWEKRRFDEIMTPARVERCGDRTDLPILSITMRSGIVEQRDRFSKTIASVDRSNYKIVKDGQLVIAFPIDEGLVYTQDVAKEGIMSPAYNIWDVDYSLVNRNFLVSYFHSRFAFDYYKAKLRGSTQRRRSMDKEDLLSMPIPVPPISEQKRIVEELDLLNGIIEKNKTQLEELDKLAQSIFYDMFGDPVTNEKGWNVKTLKDVSTLINGRAYKQDELLNEGKYKVLRVGNFFTNSSYYYSNLELEENKYCDYGDLLFAWSASFGAFIWEGEKVIFHYHIWKVLYNESLLNKVFYCYLLNTMTNSFMNDLHGIGMMHLTKEGMEKYKLPLPHLSLQQEFADKISAIESMKAKVRQSLKEAEQLFNSRMDFYFN